MFLGRVGRSRRIRHWLLSGCAAAVLLAATAPADADTTPPAAGEPAPSAAASDDKRAFSVAQQPLLSALNQWSLATGRDWGHIGPGFGNIETSGVSGEFTDFEALSRILAGTGFTFNAVATGDVSIVKIQADAPSPNRTLIDPAANNDEEIERIIVRGVTAQRRLEDIQEVPLAVTAFDANALDRRQIFNTADLSRNVLNLIGANNVGLGTSVTYFMRGAGSTESIATFDLPVGTYIDEVYISRQNGNQIRLSGVERVEALRGPQGTLFGRNTTGGAVSIITEKPHEDFDAGLEVGYGSYDRVTASAHANLPLSDNAFTRISAFVVNEDGFMESIFNDETFNGEKSWGVRGALRFLPFDNVTWDVSAQYIETDYLQIGTPDIVTVIDPGPPTSTEGMQVPSTGDLHKVRLTDRECEPEGPPPTWPAQGCHFNSADAFLLISNLQFELGAGTLNLITGFYDLTQRFNIDFIGNTDQPVFGGAFGANFYISNDGSHRQVSQEVKWTGSLLDGRLNYVSGFFFMQEDNETRFTDSIFFLGAPLVVADRTPLENDTRSIAFYTQADFRFLEDWKLQAGVRWTEEDKDLSLDGVALDFGTFSYVPHDSAALEAAGIPLHQNASRWTPRVALSYDITDDHMIYASFTQGFKSGGWNARGLAAVELQAFGPEMVDSYEAGLRTEWFGRRLLANLTVFRAIYDDYQIPSVFPSANNFLTLNSGTLEVDGLELEVAAAITDTLQVFGNLGLMDGEYTKLTPAAIGAGIDPFDEPQRTPKVMALVGFSQDFYLPGDHMLTFYGDVKYTDDFEFLPANLPEGHIDDTVLFNAQISWTSPGKNWALIAECRNCTDHEWFTQNFFNLLYPADPRRWGVRVQYRY